MYYAMGMRYVLLMLFSTSCFAGDWTTADTARQATFTGLAVIDWAQTRYIAKHPEFYETNAVLGPHPSTGRVDLYFPVAIVGHAAISYILPPSWRQGWQYVWIGVETQKTTHNHSIGIKMSF
jgi:hypothetical protein